MSSIHTFLSISTRENNDEYVEFTDYFGSHAFLSHVWTKQLSSSDIEKQLSHLPPFRIQGDLIEFETQRRVDGSTFKPTGRYCSWNKLSQLNPGVVRPQPDPHFFTATSACKAPTSQFNAHPNGKQKRERLEKQVKPVQATVAASAPAKASGASRWAGMDSAVVENKLSKESKQPALINRLSKNVRESGEKHAQHTDTQSPQPSRHTDSQTNVSPAPNRVTASSATSNGHNSDRPLSPHLVQRSDANNQNNVKPRRLSLNRSSKLNCGGGNSSEKEGSTTSIDSSSSRWASVTPTLTSPSTVHESTSKSTPSVPLKLPPSGPRGVGVINGHGKVEKDDNDNSNDNNDNAHNAHNAYTKGHARQGSVNELLLRLRAATLSEGGVSGVDTSKERNVQPQHIQRNKRTQHTQHAHTQTPRRQSQTKPHPQPQSSRISQANSVQTTGEIGARASKYASDEMAVETEGRGALVPVTRGQRTQQEPRSAPRAPKSMRRNNPASAFIPTRAPFAQATQPAPPTQPIQPAKLAAPHHPHQNPLLKHKTSLASQISWADDDDLDEDLPDITCLNQRPYKER
ncbi:hypothetical protein E3P86_03767 [Wallemia ichthyophaga]|uniref:Uncharacterized protein n=1 Tax=Wallemia ichthyophaga TaxID=245174 RepID=A0A4T0IGW7_WALIC|nr:hypothetical protein E3P86_03767 [Wallemia ichthyophaga]